MRLGIKIILSFFCISFLIAAIGLISNWYTSSIQEQLSTINKETTQVVEYTAEMERALYQSLIFLNAIKESDLQQEVANGITIDEPTVELLKSEFEEEMERVSQSLDKVSQFLILAEIKDSTEQISDIDRLKDRFQLYERLSKDWLVMKAEGSGQARVIYTTTISPYFRNRIIPVISHLRQHTVDLQNVERESLNQNLEQANVVVKIVTLIFVVLSLGIAVFVYRSIADPLLKLNRSATLLGKGNLDERIHIDNNDEIGQLATSFNEMASNLKKRTMARDYLDNIIESIQEALIVTDEQGIVVGLNKAAVKLLHYTKDEVMGVPVKQYYNLEDLGNEYDKHAGEDKVFEFSLITKRGKKVPVLFSESRLINSLGEEVGKVAVATDITQRKEADKQLRDSLREKEVLLSEIHHRVKNNLAVVSGLLQLQIFDTQNEEVNKALKESQSRIQSISLVHEMLYHSDSLAYIEYNNYVNDLLQAISSMHLSSDKDIRIRSEIDKISLDLNHAIPCSLLLNEIVVNAFKHAFSDQNDGEIYVEMKEEGKEITMVIEDNGVGYRSDSDSKKQGLGITLINTLTHQLNGTIEFDTLENKVGSRTTVRFRTDKSEGSDIA